MVHCAVDSMLSHDSPLSRKYETRLPYMDANRESGWKTRCGCSVRNSKRAKHRGSVVLNGSRGVLNSSARDALAATPPHALRARNLHTPPPTCPPSRPAPALASRPPPKTAPPRYAARTRRLPRALPSRVPRPFPASAPVARARPIARGAETDATRALHAPWHLFLACARGVAPPRRVLPPTRGDARGSPRRAFQNVPLLSWLGASDPPPLSSLPRALLQLSLIHI